MNGRLDRFDQMLVQTVKYINFITLMGGGGGGCVCVCSNCAMSWFDL